MRCNNAFLAATALLDGFVLFSNSLWILGAFAYLASARYDANVLSPVLSSRFPRSPCKNHVASSRARFNSPSIRLWSSAMREKTSALATRSPCSSGVSSLTRSKATKSRTSAEIDQQFLCGTPATRSKDPFVALLVLPNFQQRRDYPLASATPKPNAPNAPDDAV